MQSSVSHELRSEIHKDIRSQPFSSDFYRNLQGLTFDLQGALLCSYLTQAHGGRQESVNSF